MDKSLRKFFSGSLAASLAAAVGFGVCGSASAHHSYAMFDMTKEVTMQGTVSEFQWSNPHIWIELSFTQDGKVVKYNIEGNSPNVLRRHGWTRDAIKVGDPVTIVIHPLKSGEPGGDVSRITLTDGRTLVN